MITGRKITLVFTIAFAFILLMELIFKRVWPHWTFNTPGLVIGNAILSYLAFFGLIFCTMLLVRAPRLLNIVFGIAMTLLFCVASCATIFPIDTTTQPRDKFIVDRFPDGRKKIIREYRNAKTGHEIMDTVIVKDVLCFRRLYK